MCRTAQLSITLESLNRGAFDDVSNVKVRELGTDLWSTLIFSFVETSPLQNSQDRLQAVEFCNLTHRSMR